MSAGLRLLGFGALLAAAAPPAFPWPAPLVEALGRDARRVVPRSLRLLLAEREQAILAEAGRLPPGIGHALSADLAAGRLAPETVRALDGLAAEAVTLLRQRQVSQGIVKLGALLRIPAELADPVLTVGASGWPPGVEAEYYAFVKANLSKMPVVLEDRAALGLARARLPDYWQRVLDRSREQSPVIRTELFVGGRLVDHRTLDYRSPVFGVASLSYSRAVTAIAATWLAAWREAHGDLTRLPRPGEVRPR